MSRFQPKPFNAIAALALSLASIGCAPMGAPVATSGSVVESVGSGAPEGTSCRLEIINEGRGRYVCRVEVECEGRLVYGGPTLGGYANCEADESGRWTHVWDHWTANEDGDPYMDWDVPRGTVEVRTRAGLIRLSVDG